MTTETERYTSVGYWIDTLPGHMASEVVGRSLSGDWARLVERVSRDYEGSYFDSVDDVVVMEEEGFLHLKEMIGLSNEVLEKIAQTDDFLSESITPSDRDAIASLGDDERFKLARRVLGLSMLAASQAPNHNRQLAMREFKMAHALLLWDEMVPPENTSNEAGRDMGVELGIEKGLLRDVAGRLVVQGTVSGYSVAGGIEGKGGLALKLAQLSGKKLMEVMEIDTRAKLPKSM